MNVLMVVADSLRADYLGYSGGGAHTPHLDELAAASINFQRMHAASFPTVPARGDYLTGRYSLATVGWGPLPREVVTVPQLLSAEGVATVGVVDTPFFVARGFNYDRGFDHFYDLGTQDLSDLTDPRLSQRSSLVRRPRVVELDYCAPHTMHVAEEALEYLTRKEPFFLYVDTWDPHEPWDPPPWYVRRYLRDYDGRTVYPVYGPYAAFGLTEEDLAVAKACYSAEITMVDRAIGRLLERLRSLGLDERTAVLFTSDHGFYFGERGGLLGKMVRTAANPGDKRSQWLRSPLYREITNVPLLVRIPGMPARNDERLVSAIDIAPTVLALFGLTPPDHMVGQSLLTLIHDEDAASAHEVVITAMPLAAPGEGVAIVDDVTRTVAEWQPISVASRDWSMLFSIPSEPAELYDLRQDPWQRTNVAERHAGVVKSLHALLVDELDRAGAPSSAIAARR